MRGGIENKSKVFFLILLKNLCCDPSLELSRQGGSTGVKTYVFMEIYGKLSLNFASYPRSPGAL